jgi:hypothetical protein
MAPAIRFPYAAFTVAVALLALAACAPTPPLFPELPRLQVSTGFGIQNLCGPGVSPAITVKDAPAGTTRYRVRMTNTSVLVQTAWQDTLPASPTGIAEAAAASYPPPCMGTYQQYAYRFEVMALDADDRPLAYGQTTATAVALDRLVRQARSTPAKPGAAATAPSPAPVLEREDDSDIFGTLPYRNYGPVVSPPPPAPAD